MAELIGTIASCVQLVECCVQLTAAIAEVYERVKGAEARLQNHQELLSNLVQTAILIQQTKLLQNPAVDRHLLATLKEALTLRQLLDLVTAKYRGGFFQRYWQAIQGTNEKKILVCFENLEQRKSALLLCINIVQSESLSGIESNVSTILGVVSERTERKTKTRWSVSATVGHIPPFREKSFRINPTNIEEESSRKPKHEMPIQCSVDVSKVTTEKRQSIITMAPPVYRSTMPQDFDPKLQPQSRTQTSQSAPIPAHYHTFQRMKIDSGVVINGDIYGKSKGRFRSGPKRAATGGNLYTDIETSSGGKVINGDVFDSPGLWK